MADSSFDIVSKVDQMEAQNALGQAQKEIAQRYDFKNVGASIDFSGEKMLIKANAEERVKAVLEVFEQKLIKRGISLRSSTPASRSPSGKEYRIEAAMKSGIVERRREEDRQDHPRRGPQERQEPDPGRRAARAVQEPRRPAGTHRAAQGQGPRRRAAVREHPLIARCTGSESRRSTVCASPSSSRCVVSTSSIRVLALVFVPRNRRPQTALAWLLAIFFIPYVGIILFLLFGSTKLPRKRRREKQREINEYILETTEGIDRVERDHPWPPWLEPIVELNRKLGAMPLVGGNTGRAARRLRRVPRRR